MLSHRTLYLHALSVVAGPSYQTTTGGTAHHPALPRQRLGPRPLLHHVRAAPGDGAPLRPGPRAAPHPGRARHRHGAGPHHGQRAAELSGPGERRRLQHAAHHDRRRRLLPGADRPHGAGLSQLPRGSRLRPHRDQPGRHLRARPKAPSPTPTKTDRLRHQAMAGLARARLRGPRGRSPTCNDVPRDMQTIGEIVIRGDNVMDGYYKEPQATAAVMTDGWLHTGDMAVWDEENYIHIVDRKKDIIISGGENISSIEVERAIFAHPAVLECAVVSAPDPQWGEVPAAFVVLKPGQRSHRTGALRLPASPHRQLQNAPHLPLQRHRAAQNRHRQDHQTRTARNLLGGKESGSKVNSMWQQTTHRSPAACRFPRWLPRSPSSPCCCSSASCASRPGSPRSPGSAAAAVSPRPSTACPPGS